MRLHRTDDHCSCLASSYRALSVRNCDKRIDRPLLIYADARVRGMLGGDTDSIADVRQSPSEYSVWAGFACLSRAFMYYIATRERYTSVRECLDARDSLPQDKRVDVLEGTTRQWM